MNESAEVKGAGLQEAPLFKDWSLYATDIVSPQLPRNIRYTSPKPNEDLRKRIKPFENKLKDEEKNILKISLSFLEGGALEDDFGKDDWKRDELLTSQVIRIGDEEITLYELAKRINKLSTKAILRVIQAGQLIGDNIRTKSIGLSEKIKTIMRNRGYFLVSDLRQVDNLALSIIEYILSQQNS